MYGSCWQIFPIPSNPAKLLLCDTPSPTTQLNEGAKAKTKVLAPFVLCMFQLWKVYFNMAVGFLTQSSLQLEKFSELKRQKILQR